MGSVVQLGGGRPRKPTSRKAALGTLRKDRINVAEPKLPPVKIPDPPDTLTEDEKVAWSELAAIVNPLSVATASDLYAFKRMVETAAMLTALRRSFIEAGGTPVYVEETKGGPQLRMRPEVYAIPTYEKLMLHHFTRWGIDPADRSRVSALTDEKPKTNPIAKFGLGATIKTKDE